MLRKAKLLKLENPMLLLFTLVAIVLGLEWALRAGFLNGIDTPHPVWIPPRFKKMDREIDLLNYEYAQTNPYRFTDVVRSKEKQKGVSRIAILGDSFVFGDGIPYLTCFRTS